MYTHEDRTAYSLLLDPTIIEAEQNNTSGKVEILRQALQNMPASKRIDTVLLDAEDYTDDVMACLTSQGGARGDRGRPGSR